MAFPPPSPGGEGRGEGGSIAGCCPGSLFMLSLAVALLGVVPARLFRLPLLGERAGVRAVPLMVVSRAPVRAANGPAAATRQKRAHTGSSCRFQAARHRGPYCPPPAPRSRRRQ